MPTRRKRTSRTRPLVVGYMEHISSKVFSDYRKQLTDLVGKRHGVYALYKGDHLYYVGLATNLRNRINDHLKDKHAHKWDKFSVYLARKVDHLRELESLILHIADPKGNTTWGRLEHALNLAHALHDGIASAQEKALKEILGKTQHKPKPKKTGSSRHHHREPALAPYVKHSFRIRREYKGRLYTATVRKDGRVRFNGKVYDSPSSAGQTVFKGGCNGWYFWRYRNEQGNWVQLNELRK